MQREFEVSRISPALFTGSVLDTGPTLKSNNCDFTNHMDPRTTTTTAITMLLSSFWLSASHTPDLVTVWAPETHIRTAFTEQPVTSNKFYIYYHNFMFRQ